MSLYKCCVLVPAQPCPRFVCIEGDSSGYAANEAHSRYFTNNLDSLHVRHPAKDGSGPEDVFFAIIDVDGARYISRMFEQRIHRKGGIAPNNAPTLLQQLATIATELGWKDDPMELLGTWEGEEE